MCDNTINLENAKGAKELYLRNLNASDFKYITQLQIRFQVKRGTEAARKALFGYLELEKKYSIEVETSSILRKELVALNSEFNQFKKDVLNHFELEQKVEISKNNLVKAVY